MARLQMVVAAVVIAACCSNAEARGRRFYQPTYQYYPTTVQSAPVVQQTVVTQPAATTQTTTAPQTTGVVQTNATEAGNGVVQASAAAPVAVTEGTPTKTEAAPAKPATTTPAPAAVGSAQWKAEQCARMGSVQHLGGGFGGGSYEGCGFGATPQQAIQSACFWGQRTPIEIGVARGANGYYSTIFYR